MKRNLQVKFLIIVAVMLVCLYGIIGIPKNKAELVENWHKNIRLGLDLRGGSHLVVQVQEQDAFNADAGTAADRLKEEAKKAGVTVAETEVQEAKSLPDAGKVAILVKGVPSTQAGQFRTLVNDQFATMGADGVERKRLPADREAEQRHSNAAGDSVANAKHDREEDQRTGSFGIVGAATPAVMPKRNCWCNCRASTIRLASSRFCRRRPCWNSTRSWAGRIRRGKPRSPRSGGVLAPGTKFVGSDVSDAQGGSAAGGLVFCREDAGGARAAISETRGSSQDAQGAAAGTRTSC